MNRTDSSNWSKEVVSNRVTVAKNTESVKVNIKAPAFSKGNSLLALCITMVALAEVFLIYLMIKSSVSISVVASSIVILAIGIALIFGFVKLWLWHKFGEEMINIKGDEFRMRRRYGIFNTDCGQVVLKNNTELLTNRFDSWSWKQFRGKGVFRLTAANTELADFGSKLDDLEFEKIIGTITDELNKLKTQQAGQTSQNKEIEHTEEETDNAPEVTDDVVVGDMESTDDVVLGEITTAASVSVQEKQIVENGEAVKAATLQDSQIGGHQHVAEGIKPPNLTQLTGGQHRAALNDYLRKPIRKNSRRNGKDRKRA